MSEIPTSCPPAYNSLSRHRPRLLEGEMAKTAVVNATNPDDLSLSDLQAEAEGLRKRINRFRESLGRFLVHKQEIIDLMCVAAIAQLSSDTDGSESRPYRGADGALYAVRPACDWPRAEGPARPPRVGG